MIFFDHGVELVTHPEFPCQILVDPPVVLRKCSICPVMHVPRGSCGEHRIFERRHGKDVLQLGCVQKCPCVAGIRCVAAKKGDAASGVAKCSALHAVAVNLTAELPGMLAHSVGNVIDKLSNRVGSLYLRPLKPAQARKEIPSESDARRTPPPLSGHPPVQPAAPLPP